MLKALTSFLASYRQSAGQQAGFCCVAAVEQSRDRILRRQGPESAE
jgi:hypothetical protein